MKIFELRLRHFRGFRDLPIRPTGHVVLMGTPGAGRSDVIDGMSRVLDPEYTRRRLADEFDFFRGDTSQPAEVEATIGELGPALEQHFLDYLEIWDSEKRAIVDELDSPEEIDRGCHSFVIRLCYRAEWSGAEQRVEEFIYLPKTSDLQNGLFTHARLADVGRLGFARIRWLGGRILDLGGRSGFRQIIEHAEGADFAQAVSEYLDGVEASAQLFTETAQVRAAIEQLLHILAGPLRLGNVDPGETFKFVPEGGAGTGLLRSLVPALDLQDGAGLLPVHRHGSTTANLFRVAEALALTSAVGGVVAMDDLGDALDGGSAMHLAAAIQRQSSQAWITTRLASVAEIFNPDEVFRLGRDENGERVACQGRTSTTKADRIAAKHWTRNLLPALSFSAVIILEGPDDFAALHSLTLRLFKEHGVPLPASRGVTFVSAAAAGSGGSSNVPRLARLARDMGLWSVGVIDWDMAGDSATILQRSIESANCIVRLPEGFAIERSLIRGVPQDALRQTLRELSKAERLDEFGNIGDLPGDELEASAITLLKSRSLHGPFVEWLPDDALPPVACSLLLAAVDAAANRTSGHIQL